MTDACDLCGHRPLNAVHRPDGSLRGLTVYVCPACGLTQSLPRIDKAPKRSATISAGADWGNLRYGKGFRVPAHMAWLSGLTLPQNPKILDVGANRGAFIEAALKRWPGAQITAIEPDARVIAPYADHPNVRLIAERLESISLDEDQFDLVYSSHTLEHLAAPTDALKDHWRVLKPGGHLLLEVPNIELIAEEDIVEEWFIDKHLYHFSPVTLTRMTVSTGFDIETASPDTDLVYLTLLARKSERPTVIDFTDTAEATRATARVTDYQTKQARNREALRGVAATLNGLQGRTVIWGAGRLFDTLVRHGGLDVSRLAGLVDKNLSAHVQDRHGLPLRKPADLPSIDPDTIFIASRDFADEIMQEARALAPEATHIPFSNALLVAVPEEPAALRSKET